MVSKKEYNELMFEFKKLKVDNKENRYYAFIIVIVTIAISYFGFYLATDKDIYLFISLITFGLFGVSCILSRYNINKSYGEIQKKFEEQQKEISKKKPKKKSK